MQDFLFFGVSEEVCLANDLISQNLHKATVYKFYIVNFATARLLSNTLPTRVLGF